MKRRRSYEQACQLAYAMDVIGERWTVLLVRELLLGPKRFNELQENLAGIGTNLLSTRLKDLARHGIVEKQDKPDSKRKSYALTPMGRGLEPVLRELIRWGTLLPDSVRRSGDHYRDEWDLIALRLLYREEKAPDLHGVVRVVSDNQELLVSIDQGGLRFDVDPQISVTAALTGDRSSLIALFQGHTSLNKLTKDGSIGVSGNKTFARKWAQCFSD